VQYLRRAGDDDNSALSHVANPRRVPSSRYGRRRLRRAPSKNKLIKRSGGGGGSRAQRSVPVALAECPDTAQRRQTRLSNDDDGATAIRGGGGGMSAPSPGCDHTERPKAA